MKTKMVFRASVLVLALFGAVQTASADFLLVDDFEVVPIGPLAGYNGWSATPATTGAVDVAVDPADPDNRVLDYWGDGSRAFEGFLSPIADETTGTLYFRMRREDQSHGGFGASHLTPTAMDPSKWKSLETIARNNDGDSGTSSTENLSIRNRTKYPVVGPFEEDTWYNVWMVANNTDQSYQVYIQGGAYAAQMQLNDAGNTTFDFRNNTSNTPDPLASFLLRAAGGAGGSSYGKRFSMYYRMAPRVLADLSAAGIKLDKPATETP